MTERLVHPEFDVETRTWFVPGHKREARSIGELLALLGPGVKAIGFVRAGGVGHSSAQAVTASLDLTERQRAQQIERELRADRAARTAEPTLQPAHYRPTTRTSLSVRLKRSAPLTPAQIAGIEPAPVRLYKGRMLTEQQINERRRVQRAYLRRKRGTPDNDGRLPPPPEPERRATLAERKLWTPEQNKMLDLWAAGVTGPEIASRFAGQTPASVGANLIPKARERGDPRAVVRNPTSHGRRHKWRRLKHDH